MDAARRTEQAGRSRVRLPSPLLALEFLTVLRLRPPRLERSEDVARAIVWYPLVGLALGLGLAGLDWLLRGRLAGAPEAALLLLALESATGFLHLDGLADCADGLLGMHDRERRFEIMKDSRAGAFGVTAIAFYLLLAWSGIVALSGPARTSAMIVVPVASRTAMVGVAFFPVARAGGLADGFRAAARSWCGAGALVLSGAFAALALGAGGEALLAVGLAAGAAVACFATLRLGGVSGDVFGAACECAQVAAFLCAGAWQGWMRPWL